MLQPKSVYKQTPTINFYLNAVDTMLKSFQDNPSLGLLLCKDKYAYKVSKPIGVANYEDILRSF